MIKKSEFSYFSISNHDQLVLSASIPTSTTKKPQMLLHVRMHFQGKKDNKNKVMILTAQKITLNFYSH